MSHVYPVFRRRYGDFDMPYDELVCVCHTETDAISEAALRNAKLTQEEKEREVQYKAGKKVRLK